ncbi:chorismate mutase [Trinickia sp. NRRL B-1857]|uniref:chorismate mutase n=1 Tax=Trinickia sp. NRRL B-1857 TaxID=3162879 RepID=UPI003D265E7D
MTPLELAPPPTIDDAIAACRTRIDSIDTDLLALIVKRVECATEIGRLKRRGGLPVYHPARERAIVANLCARARGALRDDHVASIWGALFTPAASCKARLPWRFSVLPAPSRKPRRGNTSAMR